MSTCRMNSDDLQRGADEQFRSDGMSHATDDIHGPSAAEVTRDNISDALGREQVRSNTADSIAEAIKPSNGVDSTAAELKDISGMAGRIRTTQDMINQAQNSTARIMQRFADLKSTLDGTTAGVASGWLNVCTAVKKVLGDSTAVFDDWVLRNFVDKTRDVQSQRLIQAKNLSTAKRRSLSNQYMNKLGEVAAQVGKPIADRLGLEVEEVMKLLGDAANATYAPEGNARLRAKWSTELAQLNSKYGKLTKAERKRIGELKHKIDRMDAYIDDPDTEGKYNALLAEANMEGDNEAIKALHWGYTNGEAKKLLDDIRRMGITDAEIDAASREFAGLFRYFRDERLNSDLIPVEVLQTWQGQSDRYVPAMGRDDAERFVDSKSSSLFDPGHYVEAEGRTTRPDSAWDNAIKIAYRTANEIGNLDFGDALVAAYMKDLRRAGADKDYKGSGLRMYDMASVARDSASGSAIRNLYAEAIQGRGGIVARVPQLDVDGNVTGFRKVVMQFDPKYNKYGENGSKINGDALNNALNDATGGVHGEDNFLQQMTGLYGQMFTRFTPGFCIVNGSRDTAERAVHMMNRTVYTESGQAINGSSLVPAYLVNAGRVLPMLGQIMRGTAPEGSAAARFGEEYRSFGLFQDYSRRFSRNSTPSTEELLSGKSMHRTGMGDILRRPEYKSLKNVIDGAGGLKDDVIGGLDRMNDYFNNIASFAQYVTLREAGVSARDAASATLEMMNLYQTGTHTNVLRALFPFVRPTVQSAMNMARTLGLSYDPRGVVKAGYRGWGTMVGAYTVASMLLPIIREQLGTDDNGNYRYDAMSSSQLSAFIPIGLSDGTYFKLPVGYGPMQVVMSLAVNSDRMRRGTGSWRDLVGETMFTFARNMLPGNWPEFAFSSHPMEYMAHMIAPAWAQPFVESATNISHFGTPVSRASGEGQAKPYQGSISTPEFYHNMAKTVYSTLGWELSPEQLRASAKGLFIGPSKLILSFLEGDYDEHRSKGAQSFAGLHPIFAAMGGTMLMGDNYNTSRSIFYNTYDRYAEAWKRAGLKLTSNKSSDYHKNKPEEKEAFQRRQLEGAGFSEDFIEDWLLLARAQSAVEKLNRASNDEIKALIAEGTYDDVRSKFRDYADRYTAVFDEAASNLRLYRS